MLIKKVIGILFVFSVFLSMTFFVSAVELTFESSGTKYFNLSIDRFNLTLFNYTVTGESHNSQYPVNISVDIADDGFMDWEYKVFDSSESILINNISNVVSNNPDGSIFNFENMSVGSIPSMFSFGSLDTSNNIYTNYGNVINEFGPLGFSSFGVGITIGSQILTIYSPNKTIHAFVPGVDVFAETGFYIASGGSSYYCSTQHEFGFDPVCDLSYQEAIASENLARLADNIEFSYSENVNNPYSLEYINSLVNQCSSPCNITVKVTSEGPGKIIFDNFYYEGTSMTFDTVYPIFSNPLANNATLNGSGIARFNITVLNSNRSVYLQINNVNYTASNNNANNYNVSVFLVNGTYSYRWFSYGNGSSHNFNISKTYSYTINNTIVITPQTGIFNAPQIISPVNNGVYDSNDININVKLNQTGYCNYSLNSGTTNNSLSTSDNLNFLVSINLANGNYEIYAFCKDGQGNSNYSKSNFSVNKIDIVDEPKKSSSGGGRSSSYVPKKNDTIINNTSLSNNSSNVVNTNSTLVNDASLENNDSLESNLSIKVDTPITGNIISDSLSKVGGGLTVLIVLIIVFALLFLIRKVRKSK